MYPDCHYYNHNAEQCKENEDSLQNCCECKAAGKSTYNYLIQNKFDYGIENRNRKSKI